MHDLTRPTGARSRSISAENRSGDAGAGGRATEGTGARAASRLGPGWKISPSVEVPAGRTEVLADLRGPGTIEHIWLTAHPTAWRTTLLRVYWEGADEAAIEVPLGDFFCQGWAGFSQVSSQVVAANPHGGLNAYWAMPFRESAQITLENLGESEVVLYYQIDLAEHPVADDSLWLHAQWRRTDPVPRGEVHTLVDVEGAGHYVGTYVAWQTNKPGWWGEGEVKFHLDDDEDHPTICGTGTEDYFGGAWNFDVPGSGYTAFNTPYLGLAQIIAPDGLYSSQQRFGLYRWHLPDPIRFSTGCRATVQALGIGPGLGNGLPHRYRQNPDDVASTAFAYLDRPAQPAGRRPPTPDIEGLEVA
ncbi:MAG: glycoside hydrolase family 172 protein [Solirubrobacteraceae bacterium]